MKNCCDIIYFYDINLAFVGYNKKIKINKKSLQILAGIGYHNSLSDLFKILSLTNDTIVASYTESNAIP
jgi:hypothetical protein